MYKYNHSVYIKAYTYMAIFEGSAVEFVVESANSSSDSSGNLYYIGTF